MYELALFAGGCGGVLAGQLLGWRTVCYVEKEPYAVEIIKARIRDGYLDGAPIWDDARTFDGRPWAGSVDIITAGFPCQPFSSAGKGLAELDERNLWPDTLRIIREIKPRWLLLENVARLVSRDYIRQIFADLAESGYDARWDCIPAAAVGAHHLRDRLWIVGHARGQQGRIFVQRQEENIETGRTGKVSNPKCLRHGTLQYLEKPECCSASNAGANGKEGPMADADIWGRQKSQDIPEVEGIIFGGADAAGKRVRSGAISDPYRQSLERLAESREQCHFWDVEPELGRVANGVAHRVDRLRAIGNGQVPAVARAAWKVLSE